jgi:hypothetical protein
LFIGTKLKIATFLLYAWPQETVLHPCKGKAMPLGLVWEMEDSSGWKRIEGDFGKF